MNNKITFPRLATMLADQSGRSKRFSEDFLREFFSLISERLEAGESVKIKGLGTFRLSRVESRKSVDVTTGMPMEISGHTKVGFIPAKELAEAVNAPFEAFTAIEISDDIDIEQLFSKEDLKLDNEGAVNEDNDVVESESVAEEREPVVFDTPEISFDKNEEEEQEEEEIDDETGNAPHEENRDNTGVKDPEADRAWENAGDFNVGITVGNNEGSDNEDKTESEGDDDEIEDNSAQAEETEEEDENDNEETPDSTETDDNDKRDVQLPVPEMMKATPATDNFDEFDDYDLADKIRASRKKNWIKGISIIFGAAIVALVATFAVWYVFATNDFNSFFHRNTTAQANEEEFSFTVGKKAETPKQVVPENQISPESDDEAEIESDAEEEVPTAPSDALVYDTVSTTRYLTTIAKTHYGNYNLWPYIYEENKAILGHPDRIRPGTPVVIPNLSKYGVDPQNAADVEKAKKLGVAIYAKYGKSI